METKNRICTMLYVYGVLALVLATIILCVIGNNECCIRNGMAIALSAISVLSIVGASFVGECQINKDIKNKVNELKKEKEDLSNEKKELKEKLETINQTKVQANAIQHEERMAIIKAFGNDLRHEDIKVLDELLKTFSNVPNSQVQK